MWHDRLLELGAVLAVGPLRNLEAHNAAADEIQALIAQIGGRSPADLDQLLEFLGEPLTRGWIAWGVLDQCSLTSAQRRRCVDVIRELSRQEGTEALAARWWLRDNRESS